MATFNEKRLPTFKKYVAAQDVVMSNLLQSLHFFDCSSPFLLTKSNLTIRDFRGFLPPKEAVVAAFCEMGAPTSR